MTAAVVGAQGFLGRALTASLRAAGVPVAEFTRATPFVSAAGEPAPDLIRAATVYYLASSINPAVAERDPDAVAADLRTFDGFLACLARLPEPPVVVLSSSGGTVYDAAFPPPYAETSPTRPKGRYAAAKLELERRLAAAAERGQCRPVVLRIANVYGPGQRSGTGQGVVAHWLTAATKREPIRLIGDTSASRDYVYVDDVAAALHAVHGRTGVPQVVNVGSGVPTSLGELAALVQRITGTLKVQHEPTRGFDVAHTWLDVSLARTTLGWAPRTPLPEGLQRTWAWLCAQQG